MSDYFEAENEKRYAFYCKDGGRIVFNSNDKDVEQFESMLLNGRSNIRLHDVNDKVHYVSGDNFYRVSEL